MAAQVIAYVAAQVPGAAHQPDHSEPTVTTVLVCDNALLRIGLQDILRGTPFAPAETTSSAIPAVVHDIVSELALVLIEAGQNTSHMLEVIRQVRGLAPQARIIALADQFDLGFVRLGHEAGVNGFCLTATAPETLIKSLELVMVGESILPFAVLRAIMDEAPQKQDQPFQDNSVAGGCLSDLKACKLSAREMQILSCLREGAPNKLIARKLEITEATIKVHVKAILRKIGAANRTQAAMWASQHLTQRGGASVNV
ncbi:LuxR C-terminal-related transcriptional regulator [Microvirga yunnanensis]|uniref:LuxR C-terminal-related transcriptional regulator n=1 Tax=Microvirga yunnanensis TaxID=2953740 RepID=UPI0021C804D9|nr:MULTISPECIES: response regulator transcription factor [unclassified Microvirga]